jgi:hypothetical protein
MVPYSENLTDNNVIRGEDKARLLTCAQGSDIMISQAADGASEGLFISKVSPRLRFGLP